MFALGAFAVDARADWPSFTAVYTGLFDTTFAIEATIKSTPSTSTYGDVWIAYTVKHKLNPLEHSFMEVYLRTYRCEQGIIGGSCGLSTAGPVVEVGTDLYAHLAHPALALRKVGANPIELTVLREAKSFADCDGDGDLAGPPSYDLTDQKAADLVSYTYTNPGNLGAFTSTGSQVVSQNALGVCGDRGMTSLRYKGGEAWACYTHTPLIGAHDVVACNSTVGAPANWIDEFDLVAPPAGTVEDHPSLEFIGADRIVATSNRDPGQVLANHIASDQLRIHFPDHAGGTPIILVDGTWANHPILDVQSATGLVQLTWQTGQGAGAAVMYSRCQVDQGASPPVLCDDGMQWSIPVALASGNDERYPHLASDGNFTIIVYTADDPVLAGDQGRVYAISRCGTGPWSAPELVRTNTAASQSQAMNYGRPGLVLNGGIAHLVMLDGLATLMPEDGNNTNGSLYWYRKSYACAL